MKHYFIVRHAAQEIKQYVYYTELSVEMRLLFYVIRD